MYLHIIPKNDISIRVLSQYPNISFAYYPKISQPEHYAEMYPNVEMHGDVEWWSAWGVTAPWFVSRSGWTRPFVSDKNNYTGHKTSILAWISGNALKIHTFQPEHYAELYLNVELHQNGEWGDILSSSWKE